MSRPAYNFELRKEKILAFMDAVKYITEKEGVEHVSIRKIAKIAGYNSATLYSYFKNLDHLILFTSIKYLKEYIISLSEQTKHIHDVYPRFIHIWKVFCETAFANPHVFQNIFFGQYSSNLGQVIHEYYTFFPEEFVASHKPILKMLGSGDMLIRNYAILEPLIESGDISKGSVHQINEIIVYCFKELLSKKCQLDEAISNQYLVDKQIAYIEYVLRQNLHP